MPASTQIKAVLFDVGGVLVSSPLKAISDFERKHGIPNGWINFAISESSPNGAWQRLERNEMVLNNHFLQEFSRDTQNEQVWQAFKRKQGSATALKSSADPTKLGDHTSLERETSASEVQRGGQNGQAGDHQKPSLSKLAKDTTIGDPVSLEAEEVTETSSKDDRQGNRATAATTDNKGPPNVTKDGSTPPSIDGAELLSSVMAASQESDPYFVRALEELSKQRDRPILGALSNDFKIGPEYEQGMKRPSNSTAADTRRYLDSNLDLYIASSDVKLRKPSKEMYRLAIDKVNEFSKANGREANVQPENVIFIDDIGENLKAASEMGMRTIKVQLGKPWRAVKELEALLDVPLMDEKTRRAKL